MHGQGEREYFKFRIQKQQRFAAFWRKREGGVTTKGHAHLRMRIMTRAMGSCKHAEDATTLKQAHSLKAKGVRNGLRKRVELQTLHKLRFHTIHACKACLEVLIDNSYEETSRCRTMHLAYFATTLIYIITLFSLVEEMTAVQLHSWPGQASLVGLPSRVYLW